jgi:hypothetical protein
MIPKDLAHRETQIRASLLHRRPAQAIVGSRDPTKVPVDMAREIARATAMTAGLRTAGAMCSERVMTDSAAIGVL